MSAMEYVIDVEQFKRVCPNCSRHKDDYVDVVDRYGKDQIRSGDAYYCSRCGFCFTAD